MSGSNTSVADRSGQKYCLVLRNESLGAVVGKPRSFINREEARNFVRTLGLPDQTLQQILFKAKNGSPRRELTGAQLQDEIGDLIFSGDAKVIALNHLAETPHSSTPEPVAGSSKPAEETVAVKKSSNAPVSAGSANPDDSKPRETAAPPPDGQKDEKCTKAGEPISMTSGEEFLALEDFALPGPIPFIWKRIYRSSFSRDMGLGHGWVHPAQATLTAKDGEVELVADDGRRVVFRQPALRGKSLQLHEGMTLEYVSHDKMVLTQPGQPAKVFTRSSESGFRVTQWRHAAYVSERNGLALDFHYDQHGRLERVQSNWGKGLVFERKIHGRISAIYQTNQAGEKLTPAIAAYEYDEAGDLIAHRNAAGHGEQYRYENHIIRQRTLATGYNFYFEWDQLTSAAKCLRQWGDNGNYAYSFAWDANNQRSAATNSRGHTVQYHYNEFGLITEEIDPEGHAHKKFYNAAGQVITQVDPLGNKTEFLYDKQQRLLRVTDPLGQRQSFGFVSDKLTYVTDAAGHVWKREYNTRGLLASVTNPLGAATRYEYHANGLVSQVIDPAGRVAKFQWNAQAELIAQTDPLGNTLHYSYDDWGRVVQVVAQAAGQALAHAEQSPVRYEYTATGLIAKVIKADGQTSVFEYNADGQLTQYTDANSRVTTYRYDDGLSQPTSRIDTAGNVIRYEYDTERNLVALINENGDKYQFFYDGNERLIKEIGFDGRVQHYKYNAAGLLISHLDSSEVVNEFERDALGRLMTKASRLVTDDKTTQREKVRFRYDALGRLVESYNEHQYLQFAYDPLGNLLEEIHTDLNDKKERLLSTEARITHAYNPLGQRLQTQLPDGQKIAYDFDESLAFRSVALNGQMIAAVKRDSLGREVSRMQGALITQTEYDPQGRLSKQFAFNKETKYSPIQRDYGYDQSGNLNFLKDGAEETRYVYDSLNRLALAANAAPEFFAFDPAGNLLSITDSPKATPGIVKGNRLLLQGDKKFEYDARGNLVREARGKDGKLLKVFNYNLGNQLIQVASAQRDQNVSFKYDPLGRRIEKRDAFGATRYLWVDNLLTQETRNQISKTYVYEPGSFRPLAQVQDEQVYHYHLDHLGTPRELTDNSGKIVWKARYKTYGNLALKEVDEVENNLRFQGQYFDEETGLHYNRFRYYSPDTGQFINQDPIGLLGGLNNYQYAPNPISWIDPMGLTCKELKWDKNANRWRNDKGQFTKADTSVFAGHGSIDMSQQYIVPAGTALTVYAWDGATITEDLGQAIEAGNIPEGVYKKRYVPGDTIPGYMLHKNCGKLTIDPKSIQVSKDTPINEILKPNMGETHWAACTYSYGQANSNVIHDTEGIFKKDGSVISKYENGQWTELV